MATKSSPWSKYWPKKVRREVPPNWFGMLSSTPIPVIVLIGENVGNLARRELRLADARSPVGVVSIGQPDEVVSGRAPIGVRLVVAVARGVADQAALHHVEQVFQVLLVELRAAGARSARAAVRNEDRHQGRQRRARDGDRVRPVREGRRAVGRSRSACRPPGRRPRAARSRPAGAGCRRSCRCRRWSGRRCGAPTGAPRCRPCRRRRSPSIVIVLRR